MLNYEPQVYTRAGFRIYWDPICFSRSSSGAMGLSTIYYMGGPSYGPLLYNILTGYISPLTTIRRSSVEGLKAGSSLNSVRPRWAPLLVEEKCLEWLARLEKVCWVLAAAAWSIYEGLEATAIGVGGESSKWWRLRGRRCGILRSIPHDVTHGWELSHCEAVLL